MDSAASVVPAPVPNSSRSAVISHFFGASWQYILSLFSLNAELLAYFAAQVAAALVNAPSPLQQLFLTAVLVGSRPETAAAVLDKLEGPAPLFVNDASFSKEGILGIGADVYVELHALTTTLICHLFTTARKRLCTAFLDELRWYCVDSSPVHTSTVLSLLISIGAESPDGLSQALVGSAFARVAVSLDLALKQRLLTSTERREDYLALRARILFFFARVLTYIDFARFFFDAGYGLKYVLQLLFERDARAAVLPVLQVELKTAPNGSAMAAIRELVEGLPP
jgi:hypothetical protein